MAKYKTNHSTGKFKVEWMGTYRATVTVEAPDAEEAKKSVADLAIQTETAVKKIMNDQEDGTMTAPHMQFVSVTPVLK